jgi:2-(1,2-epoxy-1,2-dihydrophenyl)acetyl-CoA isomerase
VNSTESIRVEFQTGLAILTLSQPMRGNPFDGGFSRDFKQVVSDLLNCASLRAVLLRADGANFSFGGDLKAFDPSRERLAPLVRDWTADLHMGLQRFWRLPVPIVTAVQGYAMGGATAMLAGCDVVLVGTSTRIGSSFTQLGFSCDSGSTVTLTSRMGIARARRFVLLAEVLSGDDALRAGLVDQVVADGQLQNDALTLALKLADGPTVAYGEIKRLFMRASASQLEAQLEDEARTLANVSATHDAQEGIAAQVERRKPIFQGR